MVIFQGITRITDNRHHATDVLGGAILGTFVAVVAVRKYQFFSIVHFLCLLLFSFAIWLVHSNDQFQQILVVDHRQIENKLRQCTKSHILAYLS